MTVIIQCAACQLPVTGSWKRDHDGRVVHADPAECRNVQNVQFAQSEASAAITLQVSLLCEKDKLPTDNAIVAAMTFGLVSLGYAPAEILITGHEFHPSTPCCPRCHSTDRQKQGRLSMGTYPCPDEWHAMQEELQPVPDGGTK